MIDFGSKVNAITYIYTTLIGLAIKLSNVGAQKIDGSLLKIYEIVYVIFLVQDKKNQDRFFKEIVLLANTRMDMVLDMPFLSLSNANINFDTKNLIWRSYTTAGTLLPTSRIKVIKKKEFAKRVLDENSESLVMLVITLVATGADGIKVHLSQASQLAALQ